jgi:mannosyl-oligosaccharide alpha-1,2-mannosidase
MNLTSDFAKARQFLLTNFRPNGTWSFFEFIIRYVGGLVSAADMTNDRALTELAVGLGYGILPFLEKTKGFFSHRFSISTLSPGVFNVSGRSQPLGRGAVAESGTFQLEFLTLSRITGDPRFAEVAMGVYREQWRRHPLDGLVGAHMGAGEDSYYEYIIKSYVLTAGVSNELLQRYLMITRDMREKLLFKTVHRKLHGIGLIKDRRLRPIMEHLATFVAGMLAVGSVKQNPNAVADLELADELVRTYATIYRESVSGVAPDIVLYNTNDTEWQADYRAQSPQYILRPESVESVYLMWKWTGLQKYRDWAWEMFLGLNRSCRVEEGFAAIANVTEKDPRPKDEMESYFLAETMKYLYLTFSDSDLLSPTEWVFNTEAHPVRIWDAKTVEKFRHLLQFENLRSGPGPRIPKL